MLQSVFIGLIALILFVLILMTRNRIIASMSLRNIFRQRANTLLVILGSLMGTALITGSFAMTDSFNKFLYSQIEREYGEVDEILTKRSADANQPVPYFQFKEIETWVNTLQNTSLTDGILPIIRIDGQTKVEKANQNLSGLLQNYLKVSLIGAEWEKTRTFGSVPLLIEAPVEKDGVQGVALSKDLADSLKIQIGDVLTVTTNIFQQLSFLKQPPKVFVQSIIPSDSFLNYKGSGRMGINGSIYLPIEALRKLINLSPVYEYNEILISNRGDFRSGVGKTPAIEKSFEEANLSQTFRLNSIKKEMLTSADEGNFGLIFLGLSAFAILAGILLISNTFTMLAEERQIELATMRALGYKRSKVALVMVFEGFFYSLLSSVIGVVAGIFITEFILGQFVNFFGDIAAILPFQLPIPIQQGSMEFNFYIKPISVFYSFILGLSLPLLVIFYTSWRNTRMNIVDSIRGLPPVWDIQAKKRFQFLWLFMALGSALLLWIGYRRGSELIFVSGILCLSFFLPLTIPFKDKRWLITLSSFWIIIFSMIHRQQVSLNFVPDAWVILVKGVAILFSCLLLVIFNLKIFERLLSSIFMKTRISKGVTKIAIAFPSKNRSRTGLTISMYTLVVFIVTLISIIPFSQEKVIQKSRNYLFIGHDMVVYRSPFGGSASQNSPTTSEILSKIPEVSSFAVIHSSFVQNIATEYTTTTVTLGSFDKDFMLNEKVDWVVEPSLTKKITTMKELIGYLIENPGTAIVSGVKLFNPGDNIVLTNSSLEQFTGSGGPFQGMPNIQRKTAEAKVEFSLRIIGAVNQNPTSFVQGILTFEKNVPDSLNRNAQVATLATVKGNTSQEKQIAVKTVSDELLSQGYLPLYVEDIIKLISAMIEGIINILRSFLYFGMLVGIAGIAILMFRALYERKRIIGMLKAIGYTKNNIFQSFFIETSFIVLLGIVLGVVSGILTSQQFLSVLNISEMEIPLSIPWGLLALVCGVFYAISLAVTFIPSYLAARIPPAEALRYFE